MAAKVMKENTFPIRSEHQSNCGGDTSDPRPPLHTHTHTHTHTNPNINSSYAVLEFLLFSPGEGERWEGRKYRGDVTS